MSASPVFHALLSAIAVGVLLSTLRRAGPRAAGLAAAVPINSVPVLFWLSLEHGGPFATTAVLGSLSGTGMTVLVGALFARLARGCAMRTAVALASLALVGAAGFASGFALGPAGLAALALAALAVGRRMLPPLPRAARVRSTRERLRILHAMGTAGAMSLAVSMLAQHAGPQWCGVVASLPLVCVFALRAAHRQGGAALMLHVLHGYLDGMTAKAAFLGGLACAWSLGAGPWAWPCALAAAGAAWLAQERVVRRALQQAPHGRATAAAL